MLKCDMCAVVKASCGGDDNHEKTVGRVRSSRKVANCFFVDNMLKLGL